MSNNETFLSKTADILKVAGPVISPLLPPHASGIAAALPHVIKGLEHLARGEEVPKETLGLFFFIL